MAAVTHLGQFWSARHREVRLLACSDVRVEGGRTLGDASGTAGISRRASFHVRP